MKGAKRQLLKSKTLNKVGIIFVLQMIMATW